MKKIFTRQFFSFFSRQGRSRRKRHSRRAGMNRGQERGRVKAAVGGALSLHKTETPSQEHYPVEDKYLQVSCREIY